MSDNELRQLIIPKEVLEASNTQEFIRFWVADGIDYVTLNIGGFVDNSKEAYFWGSSLADIAWHVVNGMQQDNPLRGTSSEMFEEIEEGYFDRLDEKPMLEGELGRKQNAH